MARIVKLAEERRQELLDAALRLFIANGYDCTPVERITQVVGVAKGTFYHYFDSKADLLEQLAENFGDELFRQLETEMRVVTGSAVERLRALYALGGELKLERRDETLELGRSMFRDENLALRNRLYRDWADRLRPMVAEIVEQGVAEGSFSVTDVRATTGIWLSLWFDYGSSLAELFFSAMEDPARIPELKEDMAALDAALERILGLEAGDLRLFDAEQIAAAFDANAEPD